MHRTIDNVEQSLSSGSQGVMSTQSRYGEKARQYGEKLRERMNAKPLQSAGMAVGAGVVLDKLFFRRAPKVRVVKVPVHTPATWDAGRFTERRPNRLMDTAGSHLQSLRGAGQEAAAKAAFAAGAGLAGTKAMASSLTRTAGTVPLQARLATQRLLARSQEYASMARTGVQAHPLVGVGAFLGVGALLTTVFMRRRRPARGTAYVTAVDESGSGVAWQRDSQPRYREMISSRPVTSAAVALGLAALVATMLRRQ
jgi:ElaB/YqjD/DUF883 family membrane-anchored ribosome-binding protein